MASVPAFLSVSGPISPAKAGVQIQLERFVKTRSRVATVGSPSLDTIGIPAFAGKFGFLERGGGYDWPEALFS
jgi:hypothetical protein